MGKIQRLDANGNLFIQGELNEIAQINRLDAAGNLFVKEFDEVSDPGSFIESTAGAGDTNLQFNVTAGTISFGSISLDHDFGSTGSITSPTSAGDGTWYNGTATGSNFEMQIVVNSITVGMIIGLENDSFNSTTGTSSWYTLNVFRTINGFSDGTANVTVRIREISVPSNMITQTFVYEIAS